MTVRHSEHDDGFQDTIWCPFCNEEDQETADYPHSLKEDGDRATMICSSCNEEFEVRLCVEYTYATQPLPGKTDEAEEPEDDTPA